MVIPVSLVSTITEALHSVPHAGHPGKDRCLHQARLEYYWSAMRKDIHSYVKCHTCAVNEGSVGKPVKILSYPTPLEPWDTLAIDLLKFPTSNEAQQYLLVAIDHFSRYSILVPLKDKTATTVATALIDNIFCPFNTPKTLLSDNGTEFNNSLLSEICKQFDIVERQNRKILSHLRSLVSSSSQAWHICMPQEAASLNSSLHASLGDTSHFVVFGQDKRLPYSLLLAKEEPIYNYDDYVRVRVSDFQKTYMTCHGRSLTHNNIAWQETKSSPWAMWYIIAFKKLLQNYTLGLKVLTK